MNWDTKKEKDFRAAREAFQVLEFERHNGPIDRLKLALGDKLITFTPQHIEVLIDNARAITETLALWIEPPMPAPAITPEQVAANGAFSMPLHGDAPHPFAGGSDAMFHLGRRGAPTLMGDGGKWDMWPLDAKTVSGGRFVGWCTVYPDGVEHDCFLATNFIACPDADCSQHPVTPGGVSHRIFEHTAVASPVIGARLFVVFASGAPQRNRQKTYLLTFEASAQLARNLSPALRSAVQVYEAVRVPAAPRDEPQGYIAFSKNGTCSWKLGDRVGLGFSPEYVLFKDTRDFTPPEETLAPASYRYVVVKNGQLCMGPRWVSAFADSLTAARFLRDEKAGNAAVYRAVPHAWPNAIMDGDWLLRETHDEVELINPDDPLKGAEKSATHRLVKVAPDAAH